MKKFFICSVLTLIAAAAFAGDVEQRSGDSITFTGGGALVFGNAGVLTLGQGSTAPAVARRILLGTPVAASNNQFVVSADMRVGTYTLATNAPLIPRNITVTATTVNGTDTAGAVVVRGTDIFNTVVTESITPVAGSTVAGTNAFKLITSITGTNWTANGTADTVVLGSGNRIGIPGALPAGLTNMLSTLGTAVAVYPSRTGTVANSTVDASAGTYDGVKQLVIYPAY